MKRENKGTAEKTEQLIGMHMGAVHPWSPEVE